MGGRIVVRIILLSREYASMSQVRRNAYQDAQGACAEYCVLRYVSLPEMRLADRQVSPLDFFELWFHFFGPHPMCALRQRSRAQKRQTGPHRLAFQAPA